MSEYLSFILPILYRLLTWELRSLWFGNNCRPSSSTQYQTAQNNNQPFNPLQSQTPHAGGAWELSTGKDEWCWKVRTAWGVVCDRKGRAHAVCKMVWIGKFYCKEEWQVENGEENVDLECWSLSNHRPVWMSRIKVSEEGYVIARRVYLG